jgi:hypothetical protein
MNPPDRNITKQAASCQSKAIIFGQQCDANKQHRIAA